MKAELVPLDGGPPIPIRRDVTVVGRREYCDIQIDHPSLSKRHAVLVKTDGLLILRDLASTNGTKVKGQRVRWAALLPDDRIAFGQRKYRVYLGADDAPAPSEQTRGAKSANGAGASARPAAFAAPSPLGTPVVPAGAPRDPDDGRLALKPVDRPPAKAPRLNEDELIIEDDDFAIVDDDDIVDL